MSRTIHALASTPTKTLAIVQTASSGNMLTPPVRLSIVVVDNRELDQLFARRVVGNPKVEVLETHKVPSNREKGSAFDQRLGAMRKAMKQRMGAASVATCDHPITTPAVLEDYASFVTKSLNFGIPGALATIHLMDPETGIVDTLEGWKQARGKWPSKDKRGRTPSDRWYALQETVWVEEAE